MNHFNAEMIREFLLGHYADQIAARGLVPSKVSDSFDLLLEGVIDSLGVLDMIGHIEQEFQVSIDLEDLNAEDITVIGPLSTYIALNAKPRGSDS